MLVTHQSNVKENCQAAVQGRPWPLQTQGVRPKLCPRGPLRLSWAWRWHPGTQGWAMLRSLLPCQEKPEIQIVSAPEYVFVVFC